jgi:hypothetical protein
MFKSYFKNKKIKKKFKVKINEFTFNQRPKNFASIMDWPFAHANPLDGHLEKQTSRLENYSVDRKGNIETGNSVSMPTSD